MEIRRLIERRSGPSCKAIGSWRTVERLRESGRARRVARGPVKELLPRKRAILRGGLRHSPSAQSSSSAHRRPSSALRKGSIKVLDFMHLPHAPRRAKDALKICRSAPDVQQPSSSGNESTNCLSRASPALTMERK
ncbi:hypothetical protein KM043_016450 [Ampulex compressa]|nr:hypothetical protein KM043_016450 [Ampulex compressa]